MLPKKMNIKYEDHFLYKKYADLKFGDSIGYQN